MNSIIIIGTGLAGYNLAKEYRKLNPSHPLVLITEDDGHFYSKPQLSTAIQYKKSPAQLIITSAEKMQAQLNAILYPRTQVIGIDPCLKTLSLKNAHETFSLSYSKLILAVGAKPKPFPLLEGFSNHYRVNTLEDYHRFIEENNTLQNCTIIGSGLVGCEFAHDLAHRAIPVTMITPDPHPLYGLVPACIGKSLQKIFLQKQIFLHTRTTLAEDNLLNNVLTAECILTAIGITPSLNLAKQARLSTQQGIVTNEYLQTSDPAIYALGDCAEINGHCHQYVAPLLHCARALAQTLHDTPTAVIFPPFPVSLKVSSYPIITLPPARHLKGEWKIESSGEDHKALFWDENECLAGYALSGKFLEERQSYLAKFGCSLNTLTNV
jgi:rubredoxin---NAD+ reductase